MFPMKVIIGKTTFYTGFGYIQHLFWNCYRFYQCRKSRHTTTID